MATEQGEIEEMASTSQATPFPSPTPPRGYIPQRDGTIVSSGLSVRYGQILALDRFTTSMPKGIVGLLGPNGAGKSTFIKALLGLAPVVGGSLTIGGLSPQHTPLPVRDAIGYMPEHDCLIDRMNAIEFLSYMGQMSGMFKSDVMSRSHEVMDFVGIGEERYRPISSYSTGMKQKVKLAQAIVHDPQFLLFDEPTNGMDPQGREEMLGLVTKIGASDKTILVSSHVLFEVERVGEHAVIIGQGKMVREGNIKGLMAGEVGLYTMVARGRKEAISEFIERIGGEFEIVSKEYELDQVSLVLKNSHSGLGAFKAAQDTGIQIRSYMPKQLSLEDVFVDALEGGEK